MICPVCANEKTKVAKTMKNTVNERVRFCPNCKTSFTTEEIPKPVQPDLFENIEYIIEMNNKDKKEGKI